jgi:hypothetical protein
MHETRSVPAAVAEVLREGAVDRTLRERVRPAVGPGVVHVLVQRLALQLREGEAGGPFGGGFMYAQCCRSSMTKRASVAFAATRLELQALTL